MTTFFFALKTHKRLGATAAIIVAAGIFFLGVSINGFAAISAEKSDDFEIEVTGNELTQETLAKVRAIDDVVNSTLVIEIPGVVKSGENSLSTNIYAVDPGYIDEEFELGKKFEKGMAMPYLVLNHTAAQSFTDENGIYTDSDKINWMQSAFKIVLEDDREIAAKISGILQANKKELELESDDNESEAIGGAVNSTDESSGYSSSAVTTVKSTAATKKSVNTKRKQEGTSEKNGSEDKNSGKTSKTTVKNKSGEVPLGNEEVPTDGSVAEGNISLSGVDGIKVFMDIEITDKILSLNYLQYSKILIKVKNFGSQKKVAERLEKLGLTAVNADMEIQKEWDVKSGLAMYIGIAGLSCILAGMILVCKNGEKDLIKNKNQYKSIIYYGGNNKDICKIMLQRSAIVMAKGFALGIGLNLILPFFLTDKYKLTSVYAYPMKGKTILILSFIGLVGAVFSYFYFRKKVKDSLCI